MTRLLRGTRLLRVAMLAFLAACGGEAVRSATAPPAAAPRATSGPPATAISAAAAPSGPRLPSLDELAARGSIVAPGMREAQRRDATMKHELRVDVARPERDACGRVLFVATAPVLARLEDSRGLILAQTTAPATTGMLAERGPVCVRRGEVLRVAYEGPADAEITVRWVAWSSE